MGVIKNYRRIKKKIVQGGSISNSLTAFLSPYTTSAVTTFSSTSVGFGPGSKLEWKLMIKVGVHWLMPTGFESVHRHESCFQCMNK